MLLALAIAGTFLLLPGNLRASTSYTYDELGRLTTAVYDNGLCVAYAYDATGNRTSQSNASASSAPTWGSGVWGCFLWTAP
jgi:YD repeat-containing protein